MNIKIIILSMILFNNSFVYSGNDENYLKIDTARFSLKISESSFQLIDNLQKNSVSLKKEFLIDPDEEKEEEYVYVSSFNFSEKVNSFEIGNGLIGIQLSAYAILKQGSAFAAAGRDVFLIYDPKKLMVQDQILEFGITKQRHRYMGCLSAKSSHFVLADTDSNGSIDIGCIKEELQCKEYYDSERDMDTILGPFFVQSPVEWYVFINDNWSMDSASYKSDKYTDLPLMDIKINPIDFFGFLRWGSYDPLKWDRKTDVSFYPLYRRKLIEKKQTGIDALQEETSY